MTRGGNGENRDKSRHLIKKTKFKENINIFKCPICDSSMDICDMKSLLCKKGHCYDIARRGYVNLLQNPPKSKYDKGMFKARSSINDMGFFDPMVKQAVNIIQKEYPETYDLKILDAGCGEGSHLAEVIKNFKNTKGFGIDISKEGIQIASKDHPNIVWFVADLANIPFTKKSFDVLLNILSPANYGEFKRVLKDDGIIIKIVPGKEYLIELREALYEQKSYCNEDVIRLFKENFNIIKTIDLKYKIPLDRENLKNLINMTPLTWGADDEDIKNVLEEDIDKITVDFTIIIGNK